MFKSCFLSHLIHFPRPNALVDDTLTLHFIPEVLTLCKTPIICFICLHPMQHIFASQSIWVNEKGLPKNTSGMEMSQCKKLIGR